LSHLNPHAVQINFPGAATGNFVGRHMDGQGRFTLTRWRLDAQPGDVRRH